MHHHYHVLAPDFSGIILMAGSWGPLLAIHMGATAIGFALSILVSSLAVIDYGMKIHWKVKQILKNRKERREQNEKKDADKPAGTSEG